MAPSPLSIAVVGHTNTGKTSLLRTLIRDVDFGEVSNRAATTRHVEAGELTVDGETQIVLYDTPGLEDSSGLLEHLGLLKQAHGGDWTDAIHWFLNHPEDQGSYLQEAKAIGQLMACDVALYVIDARDRVVGKHRDELEILGRTGRPVLPVLNFVADGAADPDRWRAQLGRVNMHAVAAFDTVAVDAVNERQLYEKLRLLAENHAAVLGRVIADSIARRDHLRQASAALLADLLIDVATHTIAVDTADEPAAEAAMSDLRDLIRGAEQDTVDALLSLHRFRPGDYLSETLPIANGRWGSDLFSTDSLTEFGIKTGSAAATGAMLGLAIDAMVGGITLGAAALTGGTIGAVAGALGSHGRAVLEGLRGQTVLRADRSTLALLTARQFALIQALLHRGHAAQDRIRPAENDIPATANTVWDDIQKPLWRARNNPTWSRLGGNPMASSARGRNARKQQITAILADALAADGREGGA